MAQQENSSEISNTPPKKTSLRTKIASLRSLFVFSKTFPFIGGLLASYTFVGIAVVSSLMDYLLDSSGNNDLRVAAVVTNLQDGLSSILFPIVFLISEEYTGCFNMITICAAASIMGLMLLLTSTSPSTFYAFYVAIIFLSLGNSGKSLLKDFLGYQLKEKIKVKKESEVEHGNRQIEKEQDLTTNIWLFAPTIVGSIITFWIGFTSKDEKKYENRYRIAVFLMGGTYLFFLFGCKLYSQEELVSESNLCKIFRISKAALGKRNSKYPTSPNCYYWKGNYKQNHWYKHGEGVRLLPRVPRLFRWLDKAAIVTTEEPNTETQETNWKLCTVREVREVKSLVPMIYLCFAFFAYSLLLATGKTFFVAQASNMRSVIGITILFLIKNIAHAIAMSRFIDFPIRFLFLCLRKFKDSDVGSQRKATTIIRIGFGMICAVICSFVAWHVEAQRLSLPSLKDRKGNDTALVPQFILLGMANGLVDGGLKSLFHGHVDKSMWSFKDSYSELVIGTGKFLIIPLVLIIKYWFKETVDTSHLDNYYLMLGILNIASLLVFAYYSFTYAYKEVCPEDEKVEISEPDDELDSEDMMEQISEPGNELDLEDMMEQILEPGNELDLEDSDQEINNEANQMVDQAASPMEECPEDEKVKVEQTLENVNQPDSNNSYPENDNEAEQVVDQEMITIDEDEHEENDENVAVSVRVDFQIHHP